MNNFLDTQATRDNNLFTANGTAALEFTSEVLKMINFESEEQINKDINLYKMGFYEYVKKYGNPFS